MTSADLLISSLPRSFEKLIAQKLMGGLLLAILVLLSMVAGGCGRSSPVDELDKLWPVPAFTLTDQTGRSLSDTDLRGKTWIATLFFTQCKGPCPMMTLRLKGIQTAVADPNVLIVSISCDPENDTVDKLAEYAKAHGSEPGRWYFVTGPLQQVKDLAVGLKLPMDEATDVSPIGHSTRFLLVDAGGTVRGIYSTEDDSSMAQLARDARRLSAEVRTTGASGRMPSGKEKLAAINAALNGCSAVLLLVGYIFVRRGRWYAHGTTMVLALLSSTAFLCCYVYSKFAYGEISTGIPAGLFRTFYYVVLFPHVLLAIAMLPAIAAAVIFAVKRDWARHKWIARRAWAVWMYVSVTGIMIYFILYHWYPALYPDAFKASQLFAGPAAG